jgi:hypothetical protein
MPQWLSQSEADMGGSIAQNTRLRSESNGWGAAHNGSAQIRLFPEHLHQKNRRITVGVKERCKIGESHSNVAK